MGGYTDDLEKDFEEFKKEHPGCGPADKAVFWEGKARELAEQCEWLSERIYSTKY